MSTNCQQTSWAPWIDEEKNKPYFKFIMQQLKQQQQQGDTIYPNHKDIFTAFNLTPLSQLKVVIIGQDPYHGENQAHGLAFSVNKGIKIPPSLANIYKEMQADLNIPIPKHGNLSAWARQGILLLNSSLTVKAQQPGSHGKIGWQQFSDQIIMNISKHKTGIIFLLWGKHAVQKQKLIDASKHNILTAAHPSPFSAYRGFFGCRHFSKTNKILTQLQLKPIKWNIY